MSTTSGSSSSSYPIPEFKLKEIAAEACESALSDSKYAHSQTNVWNTNIINNVLKSLVDQTPKDKYKFTVTSTLIQHDSQRQGRGMHCATGSYWDMARDGSWSYKLDGGERRDYDVVVNVVWVAHGEA